MTITTLRRYVHVAVLGLSALLAACDGGGGGDGDGESEESLTLAVTSTTLMAGQTTQASLRDAQGFTIDARSLTWSSSDQTVATVSRSGFVATLHPGIATISAGDPMVAAHGETTIVVSAPRGPVLFATTEVSPPVLPESPTGLALMVDGSQSTRSVSLQLQRPPFESIELNRIGDSTRFVAVLSEQQADFRPYETNCPTGACYLGTVFIADADPNIIEGRQVFVPVLPSDAPPVTVTALGPDIQSTDYVVNIRNDRLRQEGNTDEVARGFYQHFGDDYEYLSMVEVAEAYSTTYFVSFRNRATGTGLGSYDVTAELGASPEGALLGIVNWGRFEFNLAAAVTSHEMGHAFMNFLTATPLGTNWPHWPISSTAIGIMGYGFPNSATKLTPLGDDQYRVDAQSPAGGFNDLELYLFGLAAPSEVGDQILFDDQVQTLEVGSVLHGPVTHVTIDDVIRAHGPRTPAWTGTPVTFRMATIVVSRGRLLTPREMAYCDLRARRGESTTASEGAAPEMPFYVATRGRGKLVTRLR